MFPDWTWVVGFYIGAVFGSFLNVVIYRMPLGISLGNPKHSFCPNCKHQLTALDLFPIFSWVFLRGKCRHCKVSVPARYLGVELFNGALFGAFWYQHLCAASDPVAFVAYACVAAALVAAIYIDMRWYIIPDQINAFLLLVGIAFGTARIAQGHPTAYTWGIPSWLAGAWFGAALIWGIAFLGLALFKKDAMGHGDIKLVRGYGAVLFPLATGLSVMAAVFLGALIGIGTILARRKATEPSEDAAGDDEEYQPESLGSLFKCGLGYLLAFDVIGLFLPKFYQSYFGEDPYAVEVVEEEAPVPLTMIPFGPSLAAGALSLMLFPGFFTEMVNSYLRSVGLSGDR